MTDDTSESTSSQGKFSLKTLFWGMGILSLILGILSYANYRQGEKDVRRIIRQANVIGAKATVEQCRDHTLDWQDKCNLASALCDVIGRRMMSACLSAKDRTEICKGWETQLRDTHFGVAECKQLHRTRVQKKQCAATYREIAKHCIHTLSK